MQGLYDGLGIGDAPHRSQEQPPRKARHGSVCPGFLPWNRPDGMDPSQGCSVLAPAPAPSRPASRTKPLGLSGVEPFHLSAQRSALSARPLRCRHAIIRLFKDGADPSRVSNALSQIAAGRLGRLASPKAAALAHKCPSAIRQCSKRYPHSTGLQLSPAHTCIYASSTRKCCCGYLYVCRYVVLEC